MIFSGSRKGLPMKARSRITTDILPKPKKAKKAKKPKKVLKKAAVASIAEQYLELRRLRERLSEAEARQSLQ
ncbi:hypothetical protein [Bradyrhizobium roseum]|uniref:hypothetical protein n=1 Tax=Bradyrhizobium roseum TaxID=3056648 RepID=UPI00261D40AC|nr:hypothetical protein [Bradyrhizobium roseus]WKA30645.1 hypothetical protein QUH67_10950 [Bradyrhizobium roseus]